MRGRTRSQRTFDIWPGFVDLLTNLLLAIIFLLAVFILGYFFVSQTLSGRDAELVRLDRQIAELADLLSLERRSNADLRLTVAQLSASLQTSTSSRDNMSLQIDGLNAEISRLRDRATEAEAQLALANQTIDADRGKIEVQLRELVSLRRDIEALRDVRAQLENEVAARNREADALRDRSKQLEARLASAEERTSLAQKEIEEKELRITDLMRQSDSLKQELVNEQYVSTRAANRINALNTQIEELRKQLQRLEAVLRESEAKDTEQQAVIADLGRRLNVALARKVEELARYRSEFFGRLREVLGDRPDITIVGDRFVFQSEVLFESGSAVLGLQGQDQLAKFATTLKEIAAKIPKEIPWIIRVDGHTDPRPIATAQFPSNWELSTARAIAVTRFLVSQGIPANRLVAAGFGEFHPLDARQDEIAYRRNRRIELKLTER